MRRKRLKPDLDIAEICSEKDIIMTIKDDTKIKSRVNRQKGTVYWKTDFRKLKRTRLIGHSKKKKLSFGRF